MCLPTTLGNKTDLECGWYTQRYATGLNIFVLSQQLLIAHSFWVGVKLCVLFSFSINTVSGITCPSVAIASVISYVHQSCCLWETVSYHLSSLSSIIIYHLWSYNFHSSSPKRLRLENKRSRNPIWDWMLQSLNLWTLSNCEVLCSFLSFSRRSFSDENWTVLRDNIIHH